MIHYKTGNLFESKAEALVNTVNTVGVMGKGIALQFKNLFPYNFKMYANACKNKELKVGQLLVSEDENLLAGNGGLNWNKVKQILENKLADLACDIYIYQPNPLIQETLKKERVKLTPARAMLLSVLYDLVGNGEFVSEFSSEKIAYFLQRFGGKEIFNLDFQPNFYGPYSGKVKHVLFYLNGSYIMGYSSKDKKPFEELGLIIDAKSTVYDFLEKPENIVYKNTVEKTKKFLTGFYSSFALELLSTIDFITSKINSYDQELISKELEKWSDRKKILFANPKFIQIAINNLKLHLTPEQI